ncbi:MAG: Ppx/GppA family phosphatase [Acidimicrobiia bacterium]|nr:Ppx/GppA family phosphatase [Acidimicrobiia bacterium]
MMRDSTPLAAIDVGTNSVHMVIARPVDGGTPEVLAREKVSVRLGQGATDMKHLAPDAIERAVAALTEFRHIADAYGAEVVAVATSAVREAENRRDFQQRVRDETGVAVEVIPGTEEARLIHLGALSAVPAAGRPHLVLDIGGGSTELIVSTGTEPQLVRSVKLGHIRLTDRFFPGGIIRAGAVEECRRHIRSFVAPEARRARAIGFDLAVGCSGTIAALASMAASSRGKRRPRSVANTTIDRDELDRTVAEVLARPHPDDRRDLRGLERTRRDVIVGGAVLLSQLFEDLGMESLVISTGALREGVLLDRFSRRQESPADGLHHLGDLRRSSVMALARSYHEDLIHAEHATEMALQLFDETQHVHGLGDRDSELLEAAGLLHNIGRFVASSAHHRHSYYLIRNSERLAGFTADELELIALVARYHRKSAPRRRHARFRALRRSDRRKVRLLAGLLRVGIGLDRTYRRAVETVHARVAGDTIAIDVEPADCVDVEIELFSAKARSSLLADALGHPVEFRMSEPCGPPGGRAGARRRHPSAFVAEERVSIPRAV